jgi:hypothetical protein
LGVRVWDSRVKDSGLTVYNLGCGMRGAGCKVRGVGCRVQGVVFTI